MCACWGFKIALLELETGITKIIIIQAAAPEKEYGAPAAPEKEYGAPAAPEKEYGAPAAPEYEAPPVVESYGAPEEEDDDEPLPTYGAYELVHSGKEIPFTYIINS